MPGIPENYAAYGQAVRQLGYFLFVQAAHFPPDEHPTASPDRRNLPGFEVASGRRAIA
ncbi:hypothetical protein [Streptomyces europaeiscabiei]|uniref:hypothetical protein n=1 Tax=Streptomyces europaeiscabiei TaxID=146819 RepID=UPI002E18DCC2|nr:hypothetical protein OG858_39970 [Streptomyces europaeiscabiei]